MVRAARTFAVLVVALAVLASAEARRELLAGKRPVANAPGKT
jgi:hypothetical protein